MKSLHLILILASSLMLGGCATQLSVTKDSGRFAESLGISAKDVLFLSYCSFGKSLKEPKLKFIKNHGAVVATPTVLYITSMEDQDNPEPKRLSMNYSDIQTVTHITHGFGCQIHIESADFIILLHIIKNPFFDCVSSKTLIDLFATKGVSVVVTQDWPKGWYDFEGTGGMSPLPLF